MRSRALLVGVVSRGNGLCGQASKVIFGEVVKKCGTSVWRVEIFCFWECFRFRRRDSGEGLRFGRLDRRQNRKGLLRHSSKVRGVSSVAPNSHAMYRVNFIHVIWKIKQCLNKYRSYSLECFRDDSSNLNVAQPCRDVSMKAGDSLNSMLEKCSVQQPSSDTFRAWHSRKNSEQTFFSSCTRRVISSIIIETQAPWT